MDNVLKNSSILYICALMTGLAGCASIGAPQTESTLAAANFTVKLADTPAKLAKLQALPQNKLFAKNRNGKVYYIYADAAGCRCLYIGNQAAYQQYQQVRIAQNIAAEQVAAAEMNQEAMMDWDAFGPYQPGYF
jgi:hypothetical protein